jgi:ribosomal protein S18 acetylase RimI-like enzyme
VGRPQQASEAISIHFKHEFRTYGFEQRKTRLNHKQEGGKLRIDIAKDGDQAVGYIISGCTQSGVGEIESIFLTAGYRGRSIGTELMKRALAWLDREEVDTILVQVAAGNESA